MATPDAAARAALAHAPYRKSSRSTATGNCVLVGTAANWIGIQDSKQHPHRTTLAAPQPQWTTFLHAIQTDQLPPDQALPDGDGPIRG
ncbi:MAG: DUF397 domain-containing protein [Pseudonocardiaceae bacterium]